MSNDATPYIEITMGGFSSQQGKFALHLQLRNIGLGPAAIQRVTLAGEELAVPKRGVAVHEVFKIDVDVTGKKIMREKVEGAGIIAEYLDVDGQLHISEAVVEQEHGNDGIYRVSGIHSTKKRNLVVRPSERKKKLVEELANLHKKLNVEHLYVYPKHKTTKDWLAETVAVLKHLDASDHQEIIRLSKAITPMESREVRKSAAHEIDTFVRRKVAEYKRYDFSKLDKDNGEEMRPDAPITRGSLRVFVSHSHYDRVQAAIIKEIWESYGMEVFVAHEDLTPSLEWEHEIQKFLRTADLFLAILTKNFRRSEWTDQETGIAYERGVDFFPIVVDMPPYGFIGKYQGMNCSGGVTEELAKDMVGQLLKNERVKSRVLDSMIRALDTSGSFDQTNDIIEKIRICEEQLDARRISAISRSWISNNQVQGSYRAQSLIGTLLRERREDIDASLLPEMQQLYQREVAF